MSPLPMEPPCPCSDNFAGRPAPCALSAGMRCAVVSQPFFSEGEREAWRPAEIFFLLFSQPRPSPLGRHSVQWGWARNHKRHREPEGTGPTEAQDFVVLKNSIPEPGWLLVWQRWGQWGAERDRARQWVSPLSSRRSPGPGFGQLLSLIFGGWNRTAMVLDLQRLGRSKPARSFARALRAPVFARHLSLSFRGQPQPCSSHSYSGHQRWPLRASVTPAHPSAQSRQGRRLGTWAWFFANSFHFGNREDAWPRGAESLSLPQHCPRHHIPKWYLHNSTSRQGSFQTDGALPAGEASSTCLCRR